MTDPEISLGQLLLELTAGNPEPQEILQRVLIVATGALDGVDGASITILDQVGDPFTTAATDSWVVDVDKAQYATLQGPCITVASTAAPIGGSPDLARSTDWPVFGPRAHELGVGALLAAGLSSRPVPSRATRPPGALNLYSRQPWDYTDADREQALLLAAIAGTAITLAEERANNRRLQEALSSRDIIGQAKGILMERHGIGAQEAFSTLRKASNQLNIKLRDIAVRVSADFEPKSGVAMRDKKSNLPRL